jgi:hypothetical protein
VRLAKSYRRSAGIVRRKGHWPLLVVLHLGAAAGQANQPGFQSQAAAHADSIDRRQWDRAIDNRAFKTGESLKFVIRYGPVQAGHAYMEVEEVVEHNARRCYRIVSRAESNGFFSAFYKVRDTAVSIIDSIGIYSWYFEKDLQEGKYRAEHEVIFDQPNQRVITKKDTVATPPFVQDVLSSFYYLRTQDLEIGGAYDIEHFAETKLYPLRVKVLRKETIRVQAGKFDCFVVEPILRSAGLFKHKGRVTVWLTDDQYRMPVLMKSEIMLGAIVAELQEHSGVYPVD